MERRELKAKIERGGYRPQPALVAEAMLRRRGISAFLTAPAAVSRAGRIQPAPQSGRQAA